MASPLPPAHYEYIDWQLQLFHFFIINDLSSTRGRIHWQKWKLYPVHSEFYVHTHTCPGSDLTFSALRCTMEEGQIELGQLYNGIENPTQENWFYAPSCVTKTAQRGPLKRVHIVWQHKALAKALNLLLLTQYRTAAICTSTLEHFKLFLLIKRFIWHDKRGARSWRCRQGTAAGERKINWIWSDRHRLHFQGN